jgi:DNA mismatch endonuclease (patch repair protein)
MDTLAKNARSELMSRVKSSGTKPEEALAKAVKALGFAAARSPRNLAGSPDLAFKRAKVAVFVDGCFWHACPLHGRMPSGESAPYWRSKINANAARDKTVSQDLLAAGWMAIRIWEHELKTPAAVASQAERLITPTGRARLLWPSA